MGLTCHPRKRPQPQEETKNKLELSKIDFCLRLEIYQSKILTWRNVVREAHTGLMSPSVQNTKTRRFFT
jgi:hypothetical protein